MNENSKRSIGNITENRQLCIDLVHNSCVFCKSQRVYKVSILVKASQKIEPSLNILASGNHNQIYIMLKRGR